MKNDQIKTSRATCPDCFQPITPETQRCGCEIYPAPKQTSLGKLLCTDDRRRIWNALRLGREIFITPEQRAVCRETGEDYGCMIAALEIQFAGFARWRRGCEWIMELRT